MLTRRDAYTERCNEVNVSMSSPKKKNSTDHVCKTAGDVACRSGAVSIDGG